MFSSFSLDDPQTWTGLLLPVLGAIAALIVGYFVARAAQQAVLRWSPRSGANSLTLAPLIGQTVRYGIIIFAIVTALGFVGVPQASILTVVGAASLALALSLQNTLSNVASGIMLAWIRPVAVGEYVKGDGVEGEVVEVGLFGTRLRSTTGLYVYTNNNRLWNGAITNYSREPRRRIDVTVTIPDTASITATRRTLLAVAKRDKRVLADPATQVIVESFNKDTVSLQMRLWVPTPDYRQALRDLTEHAKLAVNKQLAAGDGGTAEVTENSDPHAAQAEGSGGPEPKT
jgi:small conductance mechanosensitive channel